MTIRKAEVKKETIKIVKKDVNLNMQESYTLSVKYLWVSWTALYKKERYPDIKSWETAMVKLIQKIQKDWWLPFTYKYWTLKKLFVFQCNILNTSLTLVDISERIVNVKSMLSVKVTKKK